MTGRESCRIVLLACSLVMAGLFFEARPIGAQTQEACPPPPGGTPIPVPSVTAQQVVDGSATLAAFTAEFTRAAGDYITARTLSAGIEQAAYLICAARQDNGTWRSGSTYVVMLTPDGRVFVHAKDMALSARLLDPRIYAEILSALGVSTELLNKLASRDRATATQAQAELIALLSREPDGAFDATTPIPGRRPGIPGASGHVGASRALQIPLIVLAGFDLGESHLVPVSNDVIDYGNPSVTARDVVDRATLKAFVAEAWDYIVETFEKYGPGYVSQQKLAFRDPNGPWRHGSVYLYSLDLESNVILIHGAFPDRFELRPLVATVRDAVTGKLVLPQVIEAAKSNPEGGFVEYYFDDPNDDTDSADIPKVGYAREFTGNFRQAGGIFPARYIIGSGFYGRTPVTRFVPVVLSAGGKNNSRFTSELALTNRGSEAAMLNFTYTADEGGGSGGATGMLGPHQQMIAPDAIEYLRGLEVPIPETGKRVGTLRVGVSGSSDVSVVVRTTTPTAVPRGRAGLAYPGVPENEGFHDEAVYLCGLRDNPQDRSNVALQNMGSAGSITLRTTVFSGNPADPAGEMLDDVMLGPGEFHQFNAVLQSAGKADPRFGGYVRVERVEGEAPFYAYGVINDNANSDGSFVFPVSAASLEGAMSQTLPALVEAGAFATELTLTNFSDQPKSLMFSVTDEKIETEDNTVGFRVPMLPGQQIIIPQALAYARQNLGLDVPTGLMVPLIASPVSGDLSGVVIGARVVAPADAEDPSKGQYGVFYTAVPRGRGFTGSAWVDGLQQNQENRSNLALVNTGEVDDQDIVFEIDIYDGETATPSKTLTMDEEDKLVVPAKCFKQIDQVLKHAPGTTQGYVKIRKVSGANPFLAYGVVNDGGAPGERTGDGAYIPAGR